MSAIGRFASAAIVFCSISAFAGAQPANAHFTLRQVMSAPFNSDLVAAPAKDRLAWFSNVEGRRNIWVAEPSGDSGAYQSHEVTHYTKDDGQELQNLEWLPNAGSIIYVRGGDPGGEWNVSPNPTLSPQGAEQDVWLVSLRGGAPRKLGAGNSPAVSPTNNQVAWVLNGQIWFENLDEQNAQPTQLLHTLGECKSLRWSPNGTKLAFVSDRGSHSFIGVYSFDTNTLIYLDPGTDHDRYPVWSPDSRRIAFIRIPYSKQENFDRLERIGQPWSILVANASTGKGSVIWTANPGPGSVFRKIVGHHQVFWGAGDHLVFPWEADGWDHLYTIPAQGGKAAVLTPGKFVVRDVSLSPDRRTVVFSSNQNDIDRRHIWSVSVTGSTPAEITHGKGIETYPVIASDDRTLAILHSGPRLPIRPAIVSAGGRLHDLAPQMIPANFPAASMVTPQPVIFSATDGLRIHGQLFLPDGADNCVQHPAVVFVHGGPQRQMLLGWDDMDYYADSYALNQYLASQGYVVLSVNYRSGIGYGLNFREPLNYGPMGDSEFRDVQGAGLYLRSRCDVQPTHIGIWGGSWGGFLTALALARASNLFAAGSDMSGVHDWNVDNPQNFAISDTAANRNALWQLAWRSSPLASVDTWRSPVLLIQGDDDRDVPFLQTVQLAAALRRQHVPFQELVFPDETHTFLLHRDWVAAYAATAEFFSKYLKPAPTHSTLVNH